jgi:DNA-directed RNA polymerase subunit RPC12/RpoP
VIDRRTCHGRRAMRHEAPPTTTTDARCPHCGSIDFVEIWEGLTWKSGRIVLNDFSPSDAFFEPDGEADGGKGTTSWECAKCEAEVAPGDLFSDAAI